MFGEEEMRKTERISGEMAAEKNSEKLALYVALIASILALFLAIYHGWQLSASHHAGAVSAAPPAGRSSGGGAGGGPGGPGGPGGGRGMRVFAPSPEYLQKYEQYVNLWKQLYPMLEEKCKTGAISNFELIRARVRRDVAQLKLMQLKGGRRPSVPFSEAYLTVKGEASALTEADLMYKAGMLPLDEVFKLQLQLAEAEFQLQEAERFLDPQRVAEAKEAVKTYPAPLTDAQMEKLLAAEQRSRGGR